MSEVSFNAQETTSQPIPVWIKIGGGGLLMLVIFSVFLLSFRGDEDVTETAVPVFTEASMSHKTDELNPMDQSLSNERLLTIENEPIAAEIKTPAQEEEIKSIKHSNEQNTQQITRMLQQLEAIQAQLTRIPEDYQQQRADIQRLSADFLALQETQTQLHVSLTKKTTQRKIKRQAKAITPKLPFTLVSIDQWGHDLSVIVRYQGQLHALNLGQSLDSWRIETINLSESQVTFRHSDGSSKTLTLNA